MSVVDRGPLAHHRNRLSGAVGSAVALVIAVVWTIPTLGLFVSAFRPAADIADSGWWTVLAHPAFTLDTLREALAASSGSGATQLTLGGSLVNSVAIAVPATAIPVVLAALAAYALAWLGVRGRTIWITVIFALQIVPVQMALVPLLRLFTNGEAFGVPVIGGLPAASGYAEVWAAHTIFALPLAIYLLHNAMAAIPVELIEAARVDGASGAQIFRRIVLPLSAPAIAAYAIFQFLWSWNDLLVALVFAGGDGAPMTAMLAGLSGTFGEDWHLLTAGAFLAIIVPLAVFFALQRYFVRGLLAGATKG